MDKKNSLPNLKKLQTTISELTQLVGSPLKGLKKKLWERDKLLVTSNLSFSHSIFKRLVLQSCKNKGLFGKALRLKGVFKTNICNKMHLNIY